jgi:hypothetical protein
VIRISRWWVLLIAFLLAFTAAPTSQPVEGAMGRVGDPFEHPVRMTGETWRVTVAQHDTFDFSGMEFYELRFSDGSALTISVDKDVPFASVLRMAKGKQTLRLEALTLSEITR